MKAENPELEGSVMTFYDHYPDCESARVLGRFGLGTLGTDKRWFLGPDVTRIGVKYEGPVPLPPDVKLPGIVWVFRDGCGLSELT